MKQFYFLLTMSFILMLSAITQNVNAQGGTDSSLSVIVGLPYGSTIVKAYLATKATGAETGQALPAVKLKTSRTGTFTQLLSTDTKRQVAKSVNIQSEGVSYKPVFDISDLIPAGGFANLVPPGGELTKDENSINNGRYSLASDAANKADLSVNGWVLVVTYAFRHEGEYQGIFKFN